MPEDIPQPGSTINIGDEFGTAKRNLPPVGIILAGLALVGIVAGVISFQQRAKPQGHGAIVQITDVEIPNQNTLMVAITASLQNSAEKTLYVHTVKAILKTSDGKEYTDEGASAIDFDRFYQAFPVLKKGAAPAAIIPEAKLKGGEAIQGTIIVTFPVTHDAFQNRKSLSLIIQPYDQVLPIVLTQ